MAILGLKIQPSVESLAAALGEAKKGLGDFRPVWREAIALISPDVVRTIESSGSALGETWSPLSPAYAKRKQREGRDPHFYFYSGALMSQLQADTHRQRITRMRMGWGPKPKYAYALSFGIPERHLPARSIMGISPATEARITDMVRVHIDQVLAGVDRTAGGR